jgi:2-polyprenyl-3-methyl-5-hydroxy-6-metoxy-1,4-benzoquinol methylase
LPLEKSGWNPIRVGIAKKRRKSDVSIEGEYKKKIYSRYVSLKNGSRKEINDEDVSKWRGAYRRYLRGWLPSDKKAAIVDVACGEGKLLCFFRENGFSNIEGVDISPEQIEIARQINEKVYEEDVLTFLEKRPEAYDLITGIDLIEHLKKDEVCRFLDACRYALKCGGRLILQTPNADSPWGMSYRYGDFTHEICFNSSSLTQLLRLSGFSNISSKEAGPVVHGFLSFLRFVLWKGLHLLLAFWNLIETGDRRSGIYTRVFLISAIKE